MTNQAAMMRVLSDFARLLVHQYAIGDALHDLVEGVNESLGIAGSGVSLADGDRIVFATASPQRITVLEQTQEGSQAGPCVEAHRSGEIVAVADVTATSERWPALTRAAAEVGIKAVAGIPMHLNGTRLGALNLYDDRLHDWSEEELQTASLLAAIATAYIANASRLDEARDTAEQLQEALSSRIVIEQAKGILAGERKISVDEAFRLLRNHARSNQASLHSVAEAVVNLGLRP